MIRSALAFVGVIFTAAVLVSVLMLTAIALQKLAHPPAPSAGLTSCTITYNYADGRSVRVVWNDPRGCDRLRRSRS